MERFDLWISCRDGVRDPGVFIADEGAIPGITLCVWRDRCHPPMRGPRIDSLHLVLRARPIFFIGTERPWRTRHARLYVLECLSYDAWNGEGKLTGRRFPAAPTIFLHRIQPACEELFSTSSREPLACSHPPYLTLLIHMVNADALQPLCWDGEDDTPGGGPSCHISDSCSSGSSQMVGGPFQALNARFISRDVDSGTERLWLMVGSQSWSGFIHFPDVARFVA